MKVGTAVTRSDSWVIFKTLELDYLLDQVSISSQEYSRVKNLINNNTEYNNELVGLSRQVESLIENTFSRIKQILPSRLSKRAIFSPLGSLVKVISGNLDEQDAIRYDSEINKLANKELSVEHKVSLIENAFDKFLNVSENMNINNGKLVEKIDNEIKEENKLRVVVSLLNKLYQILNNFHIIFNIIQEVETAIAFSKLHTLHQSIINSTELLAILSNVEKYSKLIYPVSKDNLVKLEKNIVVKSYSNSDKLVFVLEVPLVEPDVYLHYKIIPIPIYDTNTHKTYTIIPKYPYLLVNRLKYRPLSSPCEEIENEKLLCKEEQMIQSPDETCIEQIMMIKNNYTSCHQHFIEIEKVKVQKIINNYWLLYTENNFIISEHCNDSVKKYKIQGTYLISPNPRCRTVLGDTSITINPTTNASPVRLDIPILQIPDVKPDIQKSTAQLDMKNVDFSDIKDIINSAKFSASELESDFVLKKGISVWTISLYLILICSMIFIIVFKLKLISYCQNRNSPKPSAMPSDNFSLKGGGVKVDAPCQISFVSTPTTKPTLS